MGTGKDARTRRVVWQWSFKRYRHDIQAINAMVERAEAVAAGKRALKRDRFVKITDADPVVDWDLVERAHRWVTVAEALTYGATLGQVAAGMGLDVDEVRVGLAGWANGQHRFGHITDAEHDQVIALLAEGDR
jgi:hypothetical protein